MDNKINSRLAKMNQEQCKHLTENSLKLFKNVRLKSKSGGDGNFYSAKLSVHHLSSFKVFISIFLLSCYCIDSVMCNRPPRFLTEGHSEIVLRLKEGPDTPIGSLIYKLKGTDPDGDALTFGVKYTYDSDVIRIENMGNNEAHIYLEKELDRESKDEYSLVLTLTDNKLGEGNFVTQSFLLLVDDVNDNEPVFRPFQSALEVPENSGPGILVTVEATDADEGAYGQVVYYLQELEGDNDVFSISTTQGKGVIRLVGTLDYERKSLYQLRVLAQDRANQGVVNTGTAALLVKIKDLEDQPPEFVVVQPVARVSEDAPEGTNVMVVKALDGDRGVNNRIRYSIAKGGNGLFAIDENIGVVYTTKALDREDPRNQINGAYILEIIATEVSLSNIRPPPEVKTEVTIIVTDVNDELPTFRNTEYECEIYENAQENTPITFLGDVNNDVFDHDQGNNGTFELYLDPPNDIFEVSPRRAINEAKFLIRVRNPRLLDYEKLKVLNMSLVAREVMVPGKFTIVPVTIHIRDRNDNFPEFSEDVYQVQVPENSKVGTVIAKVEATDVDSGNYGTAGIRYVNLSGSIANLLTMDEVSGIIAIKENNSQAFDRELASKHYLTVEARDNLGQGNRNTVQLIVDVTDVNDNAPIFLQNKYEARLLENKFDFENPLVIEANDLDVKDTPNSQITYAIVDGELKRNFTIHPQTGTIGLASTIDFEKLARGASNVRPIFLTVEAFDAGHPPQSSRVPVTIYVQDVNDHAPQFAQPYYRLTVPENAVPGTPIVEVTASDMDGSAPNNDIVYRIQSGASDKFVIGSNTGIISVANGASLDPDQTDPKTEYYSMVVLALDGGIGDQQLAATAMVNITILDVNNKSPTFQDPGTLMVKENTPVGTYVHRLVATDLDAKPMLRYYLDANSSEARSAEGVLVKQSEYDYVSSFDLNSVDGLIRIVKLLDREKVETIKLGFIIEDVASAKDRQYTSGVLKIVIEDENDNNPKFQKPFYKKSIPENSPIGVVMLNVVANDIDKNRTIDYSLEGPAEIIELIHLDRESGEVVVANRIDHEMYEWLNFTVRATDSGVPARATLVDVFIRVIDENDNNPYFVGNVKNLSIAENSAVGTRIAKIEANDADSGDNGKITFLMDRISSHGKFSIDADTGVLSVADNLDRESKDSYMIVIEAWDNYQFGYTSGESRNAFKQIHITILDVNDSPPVLLVPKGCVQITEFHDVHEPVTAIRSEDKDDPKLPNGQMEFEIIDGTGMTLFELEPIDAWNAKIYAKIALNKFYGNYTLLIACKDLGLPQNVVHEMLEICVQDYNDHAPVFLSPANNVTIRIPENATIDSTIVQMVATDEDVGPNAAVRFRMKPDAMGNYRSFAIDESTGVLTLKRPLDRERQKLYEIRVEAYDQGIPTPLSADLDLIIYVKNVNDYEPQFLIEEITVNFTEHTFPGLERKKLPDTVDRDEVDDLDDPPSMVCYFIVYGNEDGKFQLDPENHILTVSDELDRETKANHTLLVKATENCAEPPPNINFSTTALPLIDSNDTKSANNDPKSHSVGIVIMDGNQKLKTKNVHRYTDYFDRYKHSKSLDFDGYESAESQKHIELARQERLFGGQLLASDSTLVRILVHVQDINDNAPRFVNKIFTGGVTTSTDFGTQFMQVLAVDKDEGENARVQYYQIGEIKETLTEGLDSLQKPPFLVDRDTGMVQLNFDPQKGMKGYFDFMVKANDSKGHEDMAHVFIYLLREDQRVRFVLRQQPPEIREKIHIFRKVLSNVTDAIVNIDDFKTHENKDGSVDKTKTDLYLHLVDKRDNSIYDVADVLRLVDQNIEQLDTLFKEFNVLDTQAAEAQLLSAELGGTPTMIWLVVSNIFLAALLIIMLVLCGSQRTNYRRQLRAFQVNTVDPHITDGHGRVLTGRVPNTNKHSVEGSNPIWMKAYSNEWLSGDEGSISHDSLDENVLTTEQFLHITRQPNKEINGLSTTNNMIRHYNLYQQIDKMTNGNLLTKKLETTEL